MSGKMYNLNFKKSMVAFNISKNRAVRFEKSIKQFGILSAVFLLLFLLCSLTGCRSTSNNGIRLFSAPSKTQIAPQSKIISPVPTPPNSPEAQLPVNTTNLTSHSPPFFSGTASIANSTIPVPPPSNIPREPSDFDKSRYEAFRPIIPPHLVEQPITPANLALPNETVTPDFSKKSAESESQSESKSQSESESESQELKNKVAALEAELKKIKELPTPNPVKTVEQLPESNAVTLEDNNKKTTTLPMFNVKGITTREENGIVRISVVDTLLFMTTSWKLTPDAEELLRRITTEIQAAYPDTEIDIEGHTDSLDVDPKNPTQKHDIASIKAGVVMDYCVKILKFNPTKIKTISYGSKHPAANNATPEGRAANNRIEIVILQQK
jgi:flagellar motor protein MotB